MASGCNESAATRQVTIEPFLIREVKMNGVLVRPETVCRVSVSISRGSPVEYDRRCPGDVSSQAVLEDSVGRLRRGS